MSLKEEIENFIKDKKPNFLYTANEQAKEEIKRVLYSGPYFDNSEIIAIIESVLTGKWMSAGESVHKFERAFSKKYNQNASVMLNSGSSANLILITAMKKYFGWKDDDEIIVSPVGFPTTIAPIVQNNLKPIFVDIEMDSLNFDIKQVILSITSRTRAIFLSPVLGNSPDIDILIKAINDANSNYLTDDIEVHYRGTNNNIQLILDSCDSLGSKWKDKYLNEYAFASSFSFYPAHHITTMEGGMISSNDEEFIKLARSFAWWGRACHCVGSANLLPHGTCGRRFDKWLDNTDCIIDHKYVFDNIGYNLKPLDLQGAIGLEQLKKVDEIDRLRKEHKNRISNIFKEVLGDLVHIPEAIEGAETSWFGVPVVMKNEIFNGAAMIEAKENKRSLINHLEANGIQTRNYFAGNILLHKGYKHLDNYKDYPNANRVLHEVFFIGAHPSYNEKTFKYIEKVLRDWRSY
jgi:CDP-6-deoxy-D-xylo-4-hexulose-3-dehydrase